LSGAARRSAAPTAPGPVRADAAWDVLVAGLLAVAAGPSPLGIRMADSSLAVHMLAEHSLLLLAGALGGPALLRLAGVAPPDRRRALSGCLAALALVGLWHVPGAFEAAVRHRPLHALMHLSYVSAGALLAVGLEAVGPFDRAVLFAASQGAMGTLALAMASGAVVYPPYPSGDARSAGVAMFVGMQVAMVAVVAGPRLGSLWRARRLALPVAAALGAVVTLSVLFAGLT
jgi:cytochrome c oxidase assembly factor CtaG